MPDDTRTEQQKKRDQALLRVTLRGEIARVSDEMADVEMVRRSTTKPQELAARLAQADLNITQVRNLEVLAYTTDKVSDITDLLKRQIGRDSKKKGWAKEEIGTSIIEALETLRAEARRIVENVPDQLQLAVDADLTRRVHLDLCREFVKHLVAEFLYQRKVQEG